jgi:transposase InsO family protein
VAVARKVLSMKLVAAVMAFVAGERMNVKAVCEAHGVSRQTFYARAARVRTEGLAGLEERSRRPTRCPHRTPAEVEDAVVTKRKELLDAGLDAGARTILWHLSRDQALAGRVPSKSTIHAILVRRGLITPEPRKRPKGSWRRFEAPAPNEWWQIDAMDWVIATGVVKIFSVLDDYARVVVACRAVTEATSPQAWVTFCLAAQHWGLPAGVLSDNGLCFSGKLRRFEVLFEANLRDAGVRPFTGRPFHPQTTGKVERFQQTLKKWLRRQPLARDLAELQAQLDRFCQLYNFQRPHQGIGRAIPAERWHSAHPAQPADRPLEHPTYPAGIVRHATVTSDGVVEVHGVSIGVGAAYQGAAATVIIDATHASVYINNQLARHLTIDPTRRYQPSGRRRGGPRQRRLAS